MMLTERALQDEISALKDEINRIADGTDFNGIKLLDGSMSAGVTGAMTLGDNTAITKKMQLELSLRHLKAMN